MFFVYTAFECQSVGRSKCMASRQVYCRSWVQYKALSFSGSDRKVSVVCMLYDMCGHLCRGSVAVDKLLQQLLVVLFHCLTNAAVAAATQRVVATTCHRIESARRKRFVYFCN